MALALQPIPERVYDPGAVYDEALNADGCPRPEYRGVLGALRRDPEAARSAVQARVDAMGATFGQGAGASTFAVDPVPRIISREEWDDIEAGLAQRARALNAFIADAYGDCEIVLGGVIPARVIGGAEHFEPMLKGTPVGPAAAVVAGFDLVRDADGCMRVLEDNLRTPSGIGYADAARRACDEWLDDAVSHERRPIDSFEVHLGAALRAADPGGGGDPSVVLLSDGPANTAWYEHRVLARRLGIPVVQPGELRTRAGRVVADLESGTREVTVIYRRTDEDRLQRPEDRRPTWVAELLLDAVRSGAVAVVNAFGTGVADDKLTHAYVEDMIRFYLSEEPLIDSVHTYDLGLEQSRSLVAKRFGELVVKPRSSYGGLGVVIGAQADRSERRRVKRLVARSLDTFIAQETIALSRHPTVCDGRLEPRHVDLRAFAISSADGVHVVPGGLTRVALQRGSLIVNSTRGGGGKDTWVLA